MEICSTRGKIKDYFGSEIHQTSKFINHVIPENTENIESLFFRLKQYLTFPTKILG